MVKTNNLRREPRGNRKQTFTIGDQTFTNQQEFEIAKSQAGISSGKGGTPTAASTQAARSFNPDAFAAAAAQGRVQPIAQDFQTGAAITAQKRAALPGAVLAQPTPEETALNEAQKAEIDRLNTLVTGGTFEDFKKAFDAASPEAQAQIQQQIQSNGLLSNFSSAISPENLLNPLFRPDLVTTDQSNALAVGFGGAAAGAAALQLTGVSAGLAGTAKLGGWSKTLLGLAGFGSAAGIGRAFTAGKASELEGDITNLATASKTIMTDVAKGGDVDQSIDTLRLMESNMIKAGGDLHLAVRTDPIANFRGKDIEEFMFNNLNSVIRRRQALERYKLDGDLNRLMIGVGVESELETTA